MWAEHSIWPQDPGFTRAVAGTSSSAAAVAVRAHRRFGRQHDLPWGVSESAYFARDHTLAYQYGPQGVPSLALARLPTDERVLAPYAAVMAAMVAPQAAAKGLAFRFAPLSTLPERVRWLSPEFSKAEARAWRDHVTLGQQLGQRMKLRSPP